MTSWSFLILFSDAVLSLFVMCKLILKKVTRFQCINYSYLMCFRHILCIMSHSCAFSFLFLRKKRNCSCDCLNWKIQSWIKYLQSGRSPCSCTAILCLWSIFLIGQLKWCSDISGRLSIQLNFYCTVSILQTMLVAHAKHLPELSSSSAKASYSWLNIIWTKHFYLWIVSSLLLILIVIWFHVMHQTDWLDSESVMLSLLSHSQRIKKLNNQPTEFFCKILIFMSIPSLAASSYLVYSSKMNDCSFFPFIFRA